MPLGRGFSLSPCSQMQTAHQHVQEFRTNHGKRTRRPLGCEGLRGSFHFAVLVQGTAKGKSSRFAFLPRLITNPACLFSPLAGKTTCLCWGRHTFPARETAQGPFSRVWQYVRPTLLAVAQKTGIPKWVALVSGNMDQNLRNPSCLILSHTQSCYQHRQKLDTCPRLRNLLPC